MNKCIFEFCEGSSGYLKITLLFENGKYSEATVHIDDALFKESTAKQLQGISHSIAKAVKLEKLPPVILAVRSERIYRHSLMLPIADRHRAAKLYKKEKKRKNTVGYTPKIYVCKYGNGYLFNTYYIPSEIISTFKKIVKGLSSRLDSVKPYGCHFSEDLQATGEYVHFYIRQKVCTIIYQRNGTLISAYDFNFKTAKDIARRYLLVVAKHEFENETVRQKYYGITSDEDIELDIGLQKLRAKEHDNEAEQQA